MSIHGELFQGVVTAEVSTWSCPYTLSWQTSVHSLYLPLNNLSFQFMVDHPVVSTASALVMYICFFISLIVSRWPDHLKKLHLITTSLFIPFPILNMTDIPQRLHCTHHPFFSHQGHLSDYSFPLLLTHSWSRSHLHLCHCSNYFPTPLCRSFRSMFTGLPFITCPNDPTTFLSYKSPCHFSVSYHIP